MTEIENLRDGIVAEEFLYDAQIRQLIDDALDKKDEKRFMELTEHLRVREDVNTVKG